MTTTTMKAAVATGFGAIDENIFVQEHVARPSLPDGDASHYMIVRVLACALAPGDVRILSGKTDYMQLPPGGHPYIIGSDVCGIVHDINDETIRFRKGDVVVCRFDEPIPQGGVAEYRLVKMDLSERAPPSITPVKACTLPASAMAARVVASKFVKPNSRVLILGGSGGVGTFLCQYVKLQGASYLAATSSQTKLCTELGCDCVIDYCQDNWWEVAEFHENKFDVVFDLVGGDNWKRGGCSGLALKREGAYVALVPGVETEIVVHGPIDIAKIMFQLVFPKMLWSRMNPFLPTWHAPEALALKPGDLGELFQDVDEGRIRVILDPSSPFPFTQDGVREAMKLQKSIHAHGKVVVKIADE
jgi:NADPH:quinone reductase-like Zn-dependent oxidoreductase